MKNYAVLLVILGASLWGTDSLFRYPLSQELAPITIVFLEHCLLSLITLPFLRRPAPMAGGWNPRDITALAFIAIGGSVVATSMFTFGIKYGNPSVVVLLQKTQPLFAVLLARILLKEKPQGWFWMCLFPAAIGAYLVAIPEWSSGFAFDSRRPLSILAALGAAALWGASTVFSRYALGRLSVLRLTALRFLVALPVLMILYFLQAPPGRQLPVAAPSIARFLAMALVPSLLALLLYYKGLQSTGASIASVAELAFPLTAVVANWLLLDVRLNVSQSLGAAVLVAAITSMTYMSARRNKREEAAPAR